MGLLQSRRCSNHSEETDSSPGGGSEVRYRNRSPRPVARRRRRRDHSDGRAGYAPSQRRGYDGRHRSVNGEVEGDGVLVYDNQVTGDSSNVVLGRGNRAGGRLAGRVSGNRVLR